jgi:hypothetical protein
MKNFFNIETEYRFEWNDLRALTMILNVIFVMIFGFSASWFGLAIAVVGIIKDLTNPQRHCNDILMHVAGVVLNCYFLSLMYRG